ncbi:MAG: glucokinase [Candidatus Woesearchaeota archaeon]|nr:glucokinase [Candidatus Woesearchaeota archaeon]
MEVLALDIGGTNTRIAVIDVDKKVSIKKKLFMPTRDVGNVSKIINMFDKKIQKACIGVAGPVTENRAKLTNANLVVDVEQLKKETKLKQIKIVNDFQAIGFGLDYMNKSDFKHLHPGNGFKTNIKMAIGAGTGLGKVHIIDGKLFACEPGWTTLGIEGIEDYALADYLMHKYNRPVYYEDVLSGRGLIDIYDYLEIKANLETNMKVRKEIKDEPVHKAKVLIKYSKKDKLCDMALNIFTRFYARFIRDSCLNILTSQVYIVGGISIAIQPYLKKHFLEEFTKHNIYNSLLKKVKIDLCLDENVGLIGAGAMASKL